ncbi:DMT family transporter [Rhodococcus kronopolitis]|uniref:DMT family transporter n=1 Tax=Rhodococcus kronopolitis TaxID=1460226 RepID=A0ABV9FRS1_9NOCA
MTDLPLLSVVCALIGALLFAVGSVAQQRAAADVADEDALLRELARSPRWWAGLLGDLGGYAFQVIALGLGSVLVVQPLIVTTLLFALPLSARYSGTRMTARTWATAGLLALSLVVFLTVGNPTEGFEDATFGHWLVPLALVVGSCVGAVAAAAVTASPGPRALLLGFASGAMYGVAVALTKPVLGLLDRGPAAVLSNWPLWALAAAGVTGFYLQQRAFHAGSLAASLPAITIAEPLVAAYLGFAVLGERLRVAGPGLVVIAVAVAVMLVTTVALSRSQARASEGAVTPDPVAS